MPYTIIRNESNASRRVVYLWCVGSNGTTPAGSETDGQPTLSIGGGAEISTTSTLRPWKAAQGEYFVVLTQSETSVLGQAVIRYNSAGALETSTPFEVVAIDSYDSMRGGLVALPNAAAEASGGLLTFGTGSGQLHVSSGSVGLKAQTHSQVTIQGVTLLDSNVTLNAAVHSGATVQGLNRLNSSVTLNVGIHSGATVGGIDASGIAAGVITSAAASAVADRFLARSLAGGGDDTRSVQNALRALRNRVEVSGSVMTVFSEDDNSSAWTASVSTAASVNVITGINPAGGSA